MIDRGLKAFAAEVIGTMVLMMAGPGSAVLHGKGIGTLGIALNFGLALAVMAFVIGRASFPIACAQMDREPSLLVALNVSV